MMAFLGAKRQKAFCIELSFDLRLRRRFYRHSQVNVGEGKINGIK
jgi:hypothetical protein